VDLAKVVLETRDRPKAEDVALTLKDLSQQFEHKQIALMRAAVSPRQHARERVDGWTEFFSAEVLPCFWTALSSEDRDLACPVCEEPSTARPGRCFRCETSLTAWWTFVDTLSGLEPPPGPAAASRPVTARWAAVAVAAFILGGGRVGDRESTPTSALRPIQRADDCSLGADSWH
jgi:hypothetical protein